MNPIFSREVTIDAPLDAVWRIFSDFDANASHWMPEVESARVPDGGLAAGAEIAVRVRGKEIRSTVLAVVPQSELELESVQGRMRAVYRYRFAALGERTRVTLDASSESSGLLRLLEPMIRKAIARVDGPSLDNLKRYVEAGA